MKERIAEAFKTLVIENQSYKISVEAICKKASISKTTFYKYFTDRYAVMEHIIEKGITDPQNKVMYGCKEKKSSRAREYTLYLLARYYEEKEFYKILLKEQGQNSCGEYITREIRNGIKNYLRSCKDEDFTEADIDYFTFCYAASFVETLKKWLNDDRDITPKTVARYFFFDY